MDNIQPYIDSGFRTVPFSRVKKPVTRNTKGDIEFSAGWKERAISKFNLEATKFGGTITGKISDLIIVDCDCAESLAAMQKADPDYAYVSKSVNKSGAHYFYKFDREFADSFSVTSEMKLDFLSEGKMAFLPTEYNGLKEPLPNPLPELKPMPDAVKELMRSLRKSTESKPDTAPTTSTADPLHDLVDEFIRSGKVTAELFSKLTPASFKLRTEYLKPFNDKGYLEPNDILDGDGNSYLLAISTRLGSDQSIDEMLYIRCMEAINALWESPLDSKKLHLTITDRMFSGKAKYQGKTIWNYNEDWRELFLDSKCGQIQIAYDAVKGRYYAVEKNRHREFKGIQALVDHVQALGVGLNKGKLQKKLLQVDAVCDPSKAFGLHSATKDSYTLNVFSATRFLQIIQDPSSYSEYKKPVNTLQFLETFVPDRQSREYLLGFLRRKLTTFDFSPVVLLFIGIPGSGKNTLMEIINKIMPNTRKPEVQSMLKEFNKFIIGSHFLHIDEVNEMRQADAATLLSKIKTISGSPIIEERGMIADLIKREHNTTIAITANKNVLRFDAADRRIATFNTPNIMENQSWVQEAGGIEKAYKGIMSEIADFCYYLATEVKNVSDGEYQRPPLTEGKQVLIADSLPFAQRIAYALKHSMYGYLIRMGTKRNDTSIGEAIKANTLTSATFSNLLYIATTGRTETGAIVVACREMGVKLTMEGDMAVFDTSDYGCTVH